MYDSSWVRKILNGDKKAGERFVSEHYPRVYRMLRCLTGRADVAEDLTQQTFLHAWQALGSFKNESRIATWLHRIAYHEYTHWLRSLHEHASLDAAADVPAPAISNQWELMVLPRSLAQLSEELREAFVLYHIDELSVREVASVLKVPTGTVKSRLFAARLRLRQLLDSEAPENRRIAPAPIEPARVTKGETSYESQIATQR